mmetsp:Transcript_14871/g.22630  ORF Transcript_14871/g.22630 Transcript_14871/m.22630 type:complete len:301 (-) Transcript_14871:259-1161(-)
MATPLVDFRLFRLNFTSAEAKARPSTLSWCTNCTIRFSRWSRSCLQMGISFFSYMVFISKMTSSGEPRDATLKSVPLGQCARNWTIAARAYSIDAWLAASLKATSSLETLPCWVLGALSPNRAAWSSTAWLFSGFKYSPEGLPSPLSYLNPALLLPALPKRCGISTSTPSISFVSSSSASPFSSSAPSAASSAACTSARPLACAFLMGKPWKASGGGTFCEAGPSRSRAPRLASWKVASAAEEAWSPPPAYLGVTLKIQPQSLTEPSVCHQKWQLSPSISRGGRPPIPGQLALLPSFPPV